MYGGRVVGLLGFASVSKRRYISRNMYKSIFNNLSHYGDILAIPFFLVLVIYFNNIKNKSKLEYVLLLFSIAGFVLDILYTMIFWSG